MSNLELACLKLHAIRLKLHYEMQQTYGQRMALVWEGYPYDYEEVEGKQLVYIKKLRITSEYTNQQAFQINRVQLNFLRHRKYVEMEDNDPNWTPRKPDDNPEPGERTDRKLPPEESNGRQEREPKKRKKKKDK